MEALECDVARLIALVSFPHPNVRYTLCDVGNNGRLVFDGLCVNWHQRQCMQERHNHHFGVEERSIPLLQTSSHESSTSKYLMGWVLRLYDGCGQ